MSKPVEMARAGAGRAPEAQERVDRWGEVHTVTWDAKRKMWAGPVQGTGISGELLRAWWPHEALKPWRDDVAGPGAVRAPEGPSKSKIPADEIPF